jgi:exodeoxyribonuclease VII large subunit
MDQKLTLSELNKQIGEVLAGAFPVGVWVIGEISELKENRNGHCYLELIEKQGNEIVARSRATIWSYTFRILKPYFETTTGQLFSQGIKILVQVSVEFHPFFGLSLNIRDIDPVYTVGDMTLQRNEIINRLKAEGVFDMNRELELPFVPQKIAVISSATAAGYQDFINQLQNNQQGYKFYTKLFPATMQGVDTVPTIISALEKIYRYEDFFDAVVIIRGGGATADLSSFDNYDLAYHVTQFPLPVITGIGHEKDDTIIDLVAHTRLKTPTAVAEFLISGVDRFAVKLSELETGIIQFAREILTGKQDELEEKATSLSYIVKSYISAKNNQLGKTGTRMLYSVRHFSMLKEQQSARLKNQIFPALKVLFTVKRNEVEQKTVYLKHDIQRIFLKRKMMADQLNQRIGQLSKKMLEREKERLHFNENTLRLISPANVLKRGYTITLKDGKIIKSVENLSVGEQIETHFSDGKSESRIIKKEKK